MRSAVSFAAGAVVCAGLLLPSLRAQDFTRDLSPEEQAAIGLAKLSPAERSALVATVERYRERSAPAGGRVADAAEAARPASSPSPAPARPSVPVNEASAAQPASSAPPPKVATAARSVRSWIPFLKDAGEASAKPKAAPKAAADEVVTRLKGELRSFSGRRSFVLENGDVWEMDEVGSYSGPVLTAPEVIVRPGAFGTHVLKVPEAALRVRVRRAGAR